MVKLATQQIGKCGELLVQYMLLKYGIESAPLTTDVGIDLLAFPSIRQTPVTIQVKTSSTHSKRAGEKWLRWQIPEACPADYIAAVDISRNKFWLIRTEAFKRIAYHRADGDWDLRISLTESVSTRVKLKEEQIKEYETEAAIPKIFGLK